MITCFGPSQSMTPHFVGTIHDRCGSGSLARLARESVSIVTWLKKSGGTESEEFMPWVPIIEVSRTRVVPQVLV